MKNYRYRAKKSPTEVMEGTIMAESEDEAIDRINEMGLLPISIDIQMGASSEPNVTPTLPKVNVTKVNAKSLIVFHRQLGQMMRSGIPILKALDFIAEQLGGGGMNTVLDKIRADVQQGAALSTAMMSQSRIFSPFVIATVKSGEAAGKLPEVLFQIAIHLEKQWALRNKVRSALAYPSFVFGVGILTVVYMLTYVIPQFSGLFKDLGQNLPLITRILIAVSGWMQTAWIWVLIVILSTVLMFKKMRKLPNERMAMDSLVLKIPKLGDIILKSELADLSSTLALMIRSGLPIITSLKMVIPTIHNEAVRSVFSSSVQQIQEGGSLSEGLRKSNLIPKFFLQLVSIGETSGKLDDAFVEISNWYQQETDESIKILTNLLEPVIILLIGLFLGLIIVAVLLPVFSINAMVQ